MNYKQIRENAGKISENVGGYLLAIEKKPFDPEYSKEIKEGKLQLSQIISMFSICLVPIHSSVFIEKDANDVPCVIFNERQGDEEFRNIRIPLADQSEIERLYAEPTEVVVAEAIAKYETTKERTYFADEHYAVLLKFVESHNKANQRKIEHFCGMIMNRAKVFDKVNQLEKNRFDTVDKGSTPITTAFGVVTTMIE